MKCFIGLDIGTSAVKGVVLHENGKVLGTASQSFEYYTEGSGKFIDADEFCENIFTAIKALAKIAKENGLEVAAICSCCASGDPVFLDENEKPITPIISWQSHCTQEDLDAVYTEEEQKGTRELIGWGIGDNMPCAHFAWILRHKPEILKNAAICTMSCEYLNFKMTKKWGISHSMATPWYLVDQKAAKYDANLLKKFGIEDKKFPPIMNKGTVLGNVTPEMAKKLGVDNETVVVLGTFDHPSGAMGAGVLEEGEMLLSCGTSWVEFFPIKDRSQGVAANGLVDRFMNEGGNSPYCVMKSLDSISEKISALRKHYFPGVSYAEFDEISAKASLGCNGLVFDYTDKDFEIGKGFAKCDIARAIYEGAAIKLRKNLEELGKFGLHADKITMVGGITNSKQCMKIISEAMGQELFTASGQETGAIGSALLAGMGVGTYKNEKEAFDIMNAAN